MTETCDSVLITTDILNKIPVSVSPDEREKILANIVAEARQQLEALQARPRTFTATLEHPRHGIYHIGVDPDDLQGTSGSILEVVLSLVIKAAHQAASRTIDSRSFDTDEEYNAALHKRAAAFQIIAVNHTAEPIRWQVNGIAPNKDPFSVYVDAGTREDADFQARWKHAIRGWSEILTIDNAAAFFASFYQIEVNSVEAKPFELADLVEAAHKVVFRIQFEPSDSTIGSVRASEDFLTLASMIEKIKQFQYSKPTTGHARSEDAPCTETEFEAVKPTQGPAVDQHEGSNMAVESATKPTEQEQQAPDPARPASEPDSLSEIQEPQISSTLGGTHPQETPPQSLADDNEVTGDDHRPMAVSIELP